MDDYSTIGKAMITEFSAIALLFYIDTQWDTNPANELNGLLGASAIWQQKREPYYWNDIKNLFFFVFIAYCFLFLYSNYVRLGE